MKLIDNEQRISRILDRPTSHIIDHLKSTTPEDAERIRTAWCFRNFSDFISLISFATPVWGAAEMDGEHMITLRWLGRTWEWKERQHG